MLTIKIEVPIQSHVKRSYGINRFCHWSTEMRALLLCLIAVSMASGTAVAQMKLSPKSAPGANETRYFTSIDGLMEGNADVILKETRQGKNVTAAVLDV